MNKILGIITTSILLFAGSAQASTPVKVFDGKTLKGWTPVPASAWTVRDASIAMTGSARGFIYTNTKYTFYRVIYSVRQVSGVNHWPCVLIFGTNPKLDAMGALQVQPPKPYTWDYRPGHNNAGNAYFTHLGNVPGVTKSAWARCEILVDGRHGTFRCAAAQPIGTKAIELVDFKDSTIKNLASPFAIQSHNRGQFDEYKDITIENNPSVDNLITTK